MTLIAQPLVALFLVMFGTGCADDMPITTRYAPADCPPTSVTAEEEANRDTGPPVPDAGGLPEERAPDSPTTSPDEGDLVDLNTADAAELATLPGVGPALAARIIDYRVKRRFEKPEDLRRVRGIGPAKYAKLKSSISVGKRQKRRP